MRGRFSASFGLAFLMSFGAGPAAGQSLADQQRELVAAQAQAARLTHTANQLEARAKSEAGAANAAEIQAAALAARVQQLEADIAAGEARLHLIEKLREGVRARLAERQRPAIRLMAAVQSYARRPGALALVQPGSVWNVVHVQLILSQLAPQLRQRTAALQAELNRKRKLEADARATLDQLAGNKAQLLAARQSLATLEATHRAAAAQLAQGAMSAQDKALALGEKARDLMELIDQLGEDSIRLSQLAALPGPMLRPLQPGQGGAPPPQSASESANRLPYRLPVTGKLVAGLGEAAVSGARAKGLVFETQASAQIIAPRRGMVVFAGPFRGYGQIIILDHGGGWTSLITNMSVLTVRVGQAVSDGAPIGRAGPGRPRIIVELRRGNIPVDITKLVA